MEVEATGHASLVDGSSKLVKTQHANMEDQVHKPHRKSNKDKKDKKEHTGGKLLCSILVFCDRRILTIPQSVIQRHFPLLDQASFKGKQLDRKM